MSWVTVIIVMNVVTFVLYAWDKLMSKNKGWRIPESTLLLLAALLGSFGAFLSMYLFRHKTQKMKFTITVPVLMLLHIIIILKYMI